MNAPPLRPNQNTHENDDPDPIIRRDPACTRHRRKRCHGHSPKHRPTTSSPGLHVRFQPNRPPAAITSSPYLPLARRRRPFPVKTASGKRANRPTSRDLTLCYRQRPMQNCQKDQSVDGISAATCPGLRNFTHGTEQRGNPRRRAIHPGIDARENGTTKINPQTTSMDRA